MAKSFREKPCTHIYMHLKANQQIILDMRLPLCDIMDNTPNTCLCNVHDKLHQFQLIWDFTM